MKTQPTLKKNPFNLISKKMLSKAAKASNKAQKELMAQCPHCKMSLAIRNPSGYCDHLYYPEYCNVCSKPTLKKKGWEERIIQEIDYLLIEYTDQKDDSRVINVLEAIDELLAQVRDEAYLDGARTQADMDAKTLTEERTLYKVW